MPVPEEKRHTEQVKLRLAPEVAATLRELAEKHEVKPCDVVALALAVLPKVGLAAKLREAREAREEEAMATRRPRGGAK